MWIVDGNNVMGSRPDGWWKDRPGAMARLAAEVAAWAALRGEEVVIVFDGRERDLGFVSGVVVRFAPHADDLIASLAGEGARVVTSDAELAGRARAAGAEVVGAGGFLRDL